MCLFLFVMFFVFGCYCFFISIFLLDDMLRIQVMTAKTAGKAVY